MRKYTFEPKQVMWEASKDYLQVFGFNILDANGNKVYSCLLHNALANAFRFPVSKREYERIKRIVDNPRIFCKQEQTLA